MPIKQIIWIQLTGRGTGPGLPKLFSFFSFGTQDFLNTRLIRPSSSPHKKL